ncbi:ATPase H(+)-transporting accessory protein 2 [Dermatophagoides farinae]|uniref:Renin receptor n=1 Tax=Dermatophagoides farinae TaxID=6954 RepID=A0A922IC07_DERFA|nr:renin receptor-like [Dermatophagoides farinae]KAH7636213.1 hypothetical protein HUG17_10183 [Dermatophagoides farinae]KAH9528260.1 Renin receptor [Dermatophagoides farinae]
MYRYVLLVIFSFITISSSSNIEILYSPDSIIFQNTTDALSSTDFSSFLSQCLGYTTKKPNWNGFYGYKNIAKNVPKSVVVFHIPVSLQPIAAHTFSMNIDSDLNEQYHKTKKLMTKTKNEVQSDFIRLSNFDEKTDLESQLNSLEKHLSKMESRNEDQPVFLWFEMFSSNNGADVVDRFSKIINHVKYLFGPNTLIVSIYDENQSILERAIRQAGKDGEKEKYKVNLAHEYDVDFHTSFITIGFASLLFILAVFIISVSMWNIDPGRDSIIYRLTSQKIKKDQ